MSTSGVLVRAAAARFFAGFDAKVAVRRSDDRFLSIGTAA